MWPTLGKRGAIAKPAEQPTKKARRRELRNRNLKLHLVFEAGGIPEVLEKKIESYYSPPWVAAYREKFGNLRSIPAGPVLEGGYRCPQANISAETISLSRRYLYWKRESTDITFEVMRLLLDKEILLTYQNREGRTTKMYPKVVSGVYAKFKAARLGEGAPPTGFNISFAGVREIHLEVHWTVPNPGYRPNWRDLCPHCHQHRPSDTYCGCRD